MTRSFPFLAFRVQGDARHLPSYRGSYGSSLTSTHPRYPCLGYYKVANALLMCLQHIYVCIQTQEAVVVVFLPLLLSFVTFIDKRITEMSFLRAPYDEVPKVAVATSKDSNRT